MAEVFRVEVVRDMPASRDQVFKVISDHRGYARYPGVKAARLIKAGHREDDGRGAVRALSVDGGVTFVEEITRFEPGKRMDYLILNKWLPMRHQGAVITLEPHGRMTRVRWVSTFEVPVPLIGGLIGRKMVAQFTEGFSGMLAAMADQLESQVQAA
jgi:uncharacterized protein YndB with AHSA1/START domain